MSKAKKAYSEIFELIKKHENICNFNLKRLKEESEVHLLNIKLKEEYGFDLDSKHLTIGSLDNNSLGSYMRLCQWGEGTGREISWSDNDEQPGNELLLSISFSTGPFIFGNYYNDDYPVDFFKKFFEELKTYKPKYLDSQNKSLYYSMDNAGVIFNAFPSILKKYYDLNAEDYKQRKIKKMKEDLEKLEKEA